MVPEVLRAMEFRVAADLLEASGQESAQLVHCRFVVAGGFDLYQLADGFGDSVFALGKKTKSLGRFAGGSVRSRCLRFLQNPLHSPILGRAILKSLWELSFRSAVVSREESAVLAQQQIPHR